MMGRPKRNLFATVAEAETPPASLGDSQTIARVRRAEGNNVYSVDLPGGKEPILVELPSRFRSQIWIRRGGFVVIDTTTFMERSNKLAGQIANIVREEKQWRKQAYWSRSLPVLLARLIKSIGLQGL